MRTQLRLGVAILGMLGAFVFVLMVVGSGGGLQPELDRIDVAEALASGPPVTRFGSAEVRIVGWYAELDGDCLGDDGGTDASVAWLQRDCPLRVLVPGQPPVTVTQAELEAIGLRLAAADGSPFPSRGEPGGPNLRLQQLVFVGHFDDAAADGCVPARVERCRNTFVVRDYDGLVR